jgi:hypothetical protein
MNPGIYGHVAHSFRKRTGGQQSKLLAIAAELKIVPLLVPNGRGDS